MSTFASHDKDEQRPNANPRPIVQPKLEIGEPDDQYEKEADAMAEKVVDGSTNATGAPAPPADVASPGIQRMSKDEEPKIQMLPDSKIQRMSHEEEPKIQMLPDSKGPVAQGSGNGPMTASTKTSQKINAVKGKGSPLSTDVKSEMESGFGKDFSNVRVHTNRDATELNKDVGAKAFTTGQDIFFNEGQYNPETQDGKRLLAHELTHTVQQQSAAVPNMQCKMSEGEIDLYVEQVHEALRDKIDVQATLDANRPPRGETKGRPKAPTMILQDPNYIDLYVALEQLERQKVDIRAFLDKYESTHGIDLYQELATKLTPDEFYLASQFLNTSAWGVMAEGKQELAVEINTAIKSGDITQILGKLARMHQKPSKIKSVNKKYEKQFGSSIVDDLTGTFAGEDLQRCNQMLGIAGDTPATAPMVDNQYDGIDNAEITTIAQTLNSELGGSSNPEIVIAQLVPFHEKPGSVKKLKTEYATKYGGGTATALVDDLRRSFEATDGSKFDYMMYLLHDVKRFSKSTEVIGSREEDSDAVEGGTVSVRGDASYKNGDDTTTDAFSYKYTGAHEDDIQFIQFLAREWMVAYDDRVYGSIEDYERFLPGSVHRYNVAGKRLSTTRSDFTAGQEYWRVDGHPAPALPYYNSLGIGNTSPVETTMHDRPDSAPAIDSLFAFLVPPMERNAIDIVARIHFKTYTIRDHKPIHMTYLIWDEQQARGGAPVVDQSFQSTEAVDSLDATSREALHRDYPNFTFIK